MGGVRAGRTQNRVAARYDSAEQSQSPSRETTGQRTGGAERMRSQRTTRAKQSQFDRTEQQRAGQQSQESIRPTVQNKPEYVAYPGENR